MTYEQMAECIELRAKGVSWNNMALIYGKDHRVIVTKALNALTYGKEYFTNAKLRKAADKKVRFLRKLGFSTVYLYELQALYGVLSPDELVLGLRPKATNSKQPYKAQRKTRKDKGVTRGQQVKRNHNVSSLDFCSAYVSKFRHRHSSEIKRIINDIDSLLLLEQNECTSD